MAKAKKTQPVVTQPEINVELLKAVAAATAVAPGYINAPKAEAEKLGELVQINPDLNFASPVGNADMPAVRVSALGTEYLAKAGGSAPAAASPAAAPAAPKQSFNVIAFELPPAKRVGGGGARPEVYPFSSLEVGKAFFVKATADKPEPWKTFASTVASATNRYKTDDTTKPQRQNRKGRMVYEQITNRQFAIRGPMDGAPFGFPGVQGAAVGRLK